MSVYLCGDHFRDPGNHSRNQVLQSGDAWSAPLYPATFHPRICQCTESTLTSIGSQAASPFSTQWTGWSSNKTGCLHLIRPRAQMSPAVSLGPGCISWVEDSEP